MESDDIILSTGVSFLYAAIKPKRIPYGTAMSIAPNASFIVIGEFYKYVIKDFSVCVMGSPHLALEQKKVLCILPTGLERFFISASSFLIFSITSGCALSPTRL